MGGGKGGSDFEPKEKNWQRGELQRHVGPNTDVPVESIKVGAEVYWLGKGSKGEGSLLRPEATGYGLVYFVQYMLISKGDTIKGKLVVISGSGNVAQYACEKATEVGAKVITLSDSNGTIHDPNGITKEKLAFVFELKNVRRGRIREYADKYGVTYLEGKNPWSIKCDIALPCATQNEVSTWKTKRKWWRTYTDSVVAEGANMPTQPEAVRVFQTDKVLFAPGKASNSGGAAVSGLEMSQNSLRSAWTREEVDANRPFAVYDHMVQKTPHWRANRALGHPKQKNIKFGCFVLDGVPVGSLLSSFLYHVIVNCKGPI